MLDKQLSSACKDGKLDVAEVKFPPCNLVLHLFNENSSRSRLNAVLRLMSISHVKKVYRRFKESSIRSLFGSDVPSIV